jgi:cell division protein FtsN
MYEINWEPSIAEQPSELSKDPAVGFTFYEGLFDTSVQTIEGVYKQVTKVGPVEPRQLDFMVQLGSFSKKESAQTLRAEIILEGYQPSQVSIQLADDYHRVMIGPFDTEDQAQLAMGWANERLLNSFIVERLN